VNHRASGCYGDDGVIPKDLESTSRARAERLLRKAVKMRDAIDFDVDEFSTRKLCLDDIPGKGEEYGDLPAEARKAADGAMRFPLRASLGARHAVAFVGRFV
jgi:hypothetical protein